MVHVCFLYVCMTFIFRPFIVFSHPREFVCCLYVVSSLEGTFCVPDGASHF